MTTAHPGRRPAAAAPPDAERLACLFAGGVLALIGLRRGGPAGAGLVVTGGALALRGVTGPSLLPEDGGRSCSSTPGRDSTERPSSRKR